MEKKILKELHEIGAVKRGNFILKSGVSSPIYIDLRLLISYPTLLQSVADKIWEKIEKLNFNIICGVPYTALPMATAISLKYQIPMVMCRKEEKQHGTKKRIEGLFEPKQNCLIIEDVITSGMSILETTHELEKEGLVIKDVVVLIDREQGGREKVEEKGYKLHPIFTMKELLQC